jgi:glycosyltransferase involved in cell wall biosynthesis
MRVLIWHGWLLEGSGSNVYAARMAEELTSAGHDVLLLCQEPHPDRYPWIDAWGTVGPAGPSELTGLRPSSGPGRCVLLRPEIGRLLPVFVVDEYEGFEVKRFVELTPEELDRYLLRNVEALRGAARWHRSELVIAGHAVPGAVVAKRALGMGGYVAGVHGSEIEYAMRAQPRYRDLAREGLARARIVVGGSSDVLARCVELVPGIEHLTRTIPPGVDVASFHPRPRRDALLAVAARLENDLGAARGRPTALDEEVERALTNRDAKAVGELAGTYDQDVPDPDAAARLRDLAQHDGPIVGYLGKLIPQKGVELLIAATHLSERDPLALVVGFGMYREWLTALCIALRRADPDALAWLRDAGAMSIETPPDGHPSRVVFTGRLDHRYAPGALAAMDVLVVPSILAEAFGMVAAEGASAGALPLVARHSGLAEVSAALEDAVARPGAFSFDPGPGAPQRIASGIDRLLSLPPGERDALREGISDFVAREWSWQQTVARFLRAAALPLSP